MPLLLQVDPGGEIYVSYAKKKLRQWHGEMLQSNSRSLARAIQVTDGSVIYVNSILLNYGVFMDRIRITGARTVLIDAAVIADIGSQGIDVYARALVKYPDAATFAGQYTVTVSADVTALTWDIGGHFPARCTFVLINQATIYGRGGAPGDNLIAGNGAPGGDGGPALALNGVDVRLDNHLGAIKSGGGGGGQGGAIEGQFPNGSLTGEAFTVPGGAGAGAGGQVVPGGVIVLHPGDGVNAATAAATAHSPATVIADTIGILSDSSGFVQISMLPASGEAGSSSGGGVAGTSGSAYVEYTGGGKSIAVTAGTSGAGGDFGEPGVAGTAAYGIALGVGAYIVPGSGGAGGAPGAAIALGGGSVTFSTDNHGVIVGSVA